MNTEQNIPEHLLYTRDHEWVLIDQARGLARIGISDFAQDALGDIVFVQAPPVRTQARQGMTLGEVESSKSVSDIYAPVSGVVVAVNESLADAPQLLNEDPYGRGWICEIELATDTSIDHLITGDAYRSLVAG